MLRAVEIDAHPGTKRCQFPTGPGTICGSPVPERDSGPGAPRAYCDKPEHNPQAASRERLRIKRRAAEESDRHRASRPLRPISDRLVTVAGLIDRLEQLRNEIACVATDATEALVDITRPDAVDREIERVRLDATERITAAEQARAAAETAAAELEARLAAALELEQLALRAADDATRAAEEAESRARDIETAAAQRITAADADREQTYDEAETALRRMREHLDTAHADTARAESERDTALTRVHELTTENSELRRRLDETTDRHRREIEARDLEYARAITAARALADRSEREHRQQISEILATRTQPSPSADGLRPPRRSP
ncbi:hypothetical protein [Nocardia blacklockiae]|uniref:hypothetical protein n=1 Tax=Nocardia blacklockiae TaxID=480036 RepID=UPI001892DBFE|nr:hypothetical protein [Nocardia blacklockiae]MBF6176063.1 hypothetical protein [Nocardia blacklockiae]